MGKAAHLYPLKIKVLNAKDLIKDAYCSCYLVAGVEKDFSTALLVMATKIPVLYCLVGHGKAVPCVQLFRRS